MKLTLENTDKIVELRIGGVDVPARIWEGQTESGVPVHCFITRVAPTVEDSPQNADKFRQFEKELKEQRKPSVEVAGIPLRLIL